MTTYRWKTIFGLSLTALWALSCSSPAQTPPAKTRHFGEIADPTAWPSSSIGTVTVLFHTNMIFECTGTLVGTRLVLTAAHCLYQNGDLAKVTSIHFSAGLNKGAAAAHSLARSIVVAPDFRPGAATLASAGNDWALIALDQPIDAKPIRVAALDSDQFHAIATAVSATQIGYGRDRRYLPTISAHCPIHEGGDPAIFEHECLLNFGYSGAPILADVDGAPAIIGIGVQILGDPKSTTSGIACSARQFARQVSESLR